MPKLKYQAKSKERAKKKWTYDVVLTTGKSARAMKKLHLKGLKKGMVASPLGKMKDRQDRKVMAKVLKIPFTPRYNGAVFSVKRELVTDKKGRLKVAIIDIKEVK